ncbi:hypothetical protein Vafri_18391 [Volvox africanus]|uniref:Uncharacterized protein n=1 Tax=Volvox africanus TaxID=51714 RepID=A0A8J4F8M8_9CHLO|nr:hypothetical protein Vafri_18391 [Volvox africanus]
MELDKDNKLPEQKPLLKDLGLPVALPPVPVSLEGTEWSSGLCHCCARPGGGALGCVALCMPFVQFGVLAEVLSKDGPTFAGGSFCCAASLFAFLDVTASLLHLSIYPGVHLLPTSAILHMMMRRHLRAKYGIKGSVLSDLCTTWWCGPCALAQETREIVIRAQKAQEAQGSATGTTHLLGHMILTPSSVTAPRGFVEPVPATGVPVGHSMVPPTHVATVTLSAPVKDTAAPALCN